MIHMEPRSAEDQRTQRLPWRGQTDRLLTVDRMYVCCPYVSAIRKTSVLEYFSGFTMFQAIMMCPSVQSPAMRVYAFLALDNETLRDSNEVIRRRAVRGRIPSINIPL